MATTFRKQKLAAAAVIAATALTGCTSAIHKTSQLGEFNMLALDARQRLVVSGRRPVYKDPTTGYFTGGEYVVCAEPSPDALVAHASYAAAAYQRENPNGVNENAAAGTGLAESAASIGLRTQSIQLMRDGYYRICEAYLNGAINGTVYYGVIAQIDMFILAMVAIESIGGVTKVPPITISPSSGSVTASVGGPADGEDGAQVQVDGADTAAALNQVNGKLASVESTLAEIQNMVKNTPELTKAQSEAIMGTVRIYAANRSGILRGFAQR